MTIEYTKKVMDYFLKPRHVGEIKNPSGIAEQGNIVCGDVIKMTIKVNPKTQKITDAKFRSYGCASNIATASVATEMIIGKTIAEAKMISQDEIADFLGGLPAIKMHCSELAVETLQKAIADYEAKQGKTPISAAKKKVKKKIIA